MEQDRVSDFKRIQNACNIVEIIKGYVDLESHGKNYFGVCPFHDDHSPSMSVSPDRQIYKCFVCGATGNVFTFVQNYLGVSFLEAVKIVADKIGETFVIKENGEEIKNKKYYDIMNLTELFYQNNLRTKLGEKARNYLLERGLNDTIIKDFGIGLSLNDRSSLYTLLSKKGIPLKDMDDLGLIGQGEKGTYDLFRNRIMFPLFSPTGKVNGYSGRIYNGETNTGKYVNTKETIIFKKRENLYNYHLAKEYARHEKFIVICEGFMDAIRIYSVGIKNVVATMGTALAKEQIALFKKLGVKVIICMDNDNAGELATVSIGEALMKEHIEVGIVRLTGKKDPDEYILTYGVEAFKDNLKNPMTYPDFMEVYLKKSRNLNNASELTEYINDVVTMISKTENDILIEVTINRLCEEFHLDKELLKSRIKNSERIENVKVQEKEEKKENHTQVITKYNKALMTMIYYMMNDSECMRLFLHYNLQLPKNRYRLVVNNLIYYYELNREIDFADYLTFCEKYEDVAEVVKEILAKVHIPTIKVEDMEPVIKIIKGILDKEKIKAKQEELKNVLDVNRKKVLMQEIIEIKKGCVENG